MSQPRAPRTARPKTGAKTAAAEIKPVDVTVATPETKPVEQPVAEIVVETKPAEVVAEQPAADVPTAKAKKVPANIGISSARTRRHIDRLGINAAIEVELAKHKKELDALKHAETLVETKKVTEPVVVELEGGKTKTEQRTRDATAEELAAAAEAVKVLSAAKADHEAHATALSRERTRFSNESAASLSFVCEEIVKSLVEHTMDAAIADSKVTIQVSHLHSAGVENLPLYPLFSTLPKFKATATKLGKAADELARIQLIETAVVAAEKKFREQYASFLPKEQKAAKAKAVKPVAETDADDTADNKVSFKFYVVHACDELKASEKYAGKNIKISNDIKTYLSDLVIEFIGRIANLVVLTVKSMKNTTVTDIAIMRTIEALLIDGHKPTDTVTFAEEQIKDPAFIKSEAEKRKLDPAYKVGEIPLITGLVAAKTTVYATSYYDTLAAVVAAKLVEFKKKPLAEQAADAGEDTVDAEVV